MSDIWLRAAFLVCVFGAVLLGVERLVAWVAQSRTDSRAVNQRLREMKSGRDEETTLAMLRLSSLQIAESLPQMLRPIGSKFDRMMTAAQLGISPKRVLLFLLLTPIALLLLGLVTLLATGAPIGVGRLVMLTTIAALIGGVLPAMILQVRANRAKRKMVEQFPIALDVFVRGLRAGHPISAALEVLTVEMPDPIGTQFGRAVDEVTYGADLRDALQSMAERWDLDDMRMFVVSLSVQSETGGNLAEVLENLTKVIRERASMMMKVRALSSEGRMTAVMLTALPILAITALFLLNPPFYLDVADDPAFLVGFVGLAVLYMVGFITIRRMVDLKV
ncbi:MAG TPA: type II secretion system F family protein [Sphingomicrobium sp.]|nr:type II secretion system F family protein [Sphingomicrobium sp.]